MAVISTVLYDVIARDNASRTFGRVGASAEAAETKTAAFGKSLTTAGLVLGGVAVAVGTQAVRMATTFQAQMTKIQTQAGGTAKDVRSLSTAVLALAQTHAEQGPTELAAALYHLKSIGLGNVAAMKALRQASDLAAVGGANLEETTSALGGAWRSGIKGAQNFHQAVATINAIIGAGNMKMGDFIEALSSGILPASRTWGVSLKSIGSALALMTDEGIPAQLAATRLRMTLSLMGAPSAKAAAALKSIGINSSQLARDMRTPRGIITAVVDLKKHLEASGLSATKQAQVISDAFGGGRSSAAIMTLLNNVSVLQRKYEQISGTTGRFTSAVAAQRKTAAAQLAMLRASTDAMMVTLGVHLLPLFTKAVRFVNMDLIPAVVKVARWLSSPQVRPWAEFFAGLAAAAVSAELIRRALSKVADFTGISRLITNAKTTTAAAPYTSAAANMGTAADVMYKASVNMLRAAGLEADASAAQGAGAAGGAASAGAAAGLGSKLGTVLSRTASTALIATLIVQLAVKPLLQHLQSGSGGKNWWNNPFGQSRGGSGTAGGLASWPGFFHSLFGGGTGFTPKPVQGGRPGAFGVGGGTGRNPGLLTGDVAHIWDLIAHGFMNTVGSPVAHWFTSSLPHAWSVSYEGFFRGFASPVAHWFEGLPASFAAVGHQWQGIWDSGFRWFMAHLGNPVAKWITVSVPHFFLKAVPSLLGAGQSTVEGLAGGLLRGARRLLPAAIGVLRRDTLSPFTGAARWLTTAGRDTVAGLIGGVRSQFRATVRTISSWIGLLRGPFNTARRWLLSAGGDVVLGLLGGIRAKIAGIAGWVKGTIVDPIISAVKHFFGIKSPSKVMAGLGSNLMLGLFRGLMSHDLTGMVTKIFGGMPAALGALVNKGLVSLVSLPGKALSALAGLGGKLFKGLKGLLGIGGGGSGVQRWAPLVSKVLGMLGLPGSYLGPWLSQMNTESGGNPRAINLTDSNARAGDPSRGLLQTIMTTFLAYAGPFRGLGIYNPLANIYAGINYALHRYGRTGMLGVIGHGHGYWQGGVITEPIFGIGRSGRPYTFGENGLQEEVIRRGQHSTPRPGPALHIEHFHAAAPVNLDLLSHKLGFAVVAAGF